ALREAGLRRLAQAAQRLAEADLPVLLAEDIHRPRIPAHHDDLALAPLLATPLLFSLEARPVARLIQAPLEKPHHGGLQLLGLERLGDVLVGATILPPEDVLLLGPRGQQDDRRLAGRRVGLHAAADLEAV